jgi:glycosyltransferase involved in cell wall biosynthesis
VNSSNVLVSVVLPCYNAEKYIKEAVTSILNQTHQNLELIIIDDCSQDQSLSILESFKDQRITIIKNEENLGYPQSMNKGISIAKGKYIARMDADDVSAHDRIALQVTLHENHPECALVSSRRCLLSPNGTAYAKADTIKHDPPFFKETWMQLYDGSRAFTDAASLVLKKNIDEVGGYQTYQRSGMDVDLWFRIMEKTNSNALVINKFLYLRRLIPEAITFSMKTKANLVLDKAYERNRLTKAIEKKTYDENQRTESFVRFLSSIAVHCFVVKDYKGFYAFLMKAISFRKYLYKNVFLNLLRKYYHFKTKNELVVLDVD